MRYEIKSISLWSVTKTAFFLNLVFGFIIGVIYALMFGFFATIAQNTPFGREVGFDPAEVSVSAMLIILPLVFGVMMAFFQTLVVVVLVAFYNMIARLVGGLEVELKANLSTADQASAPPSAPPPAPRRSVAPPLPPIAEPQAKSATAIVVERPITPESIPETEPRPETPSRSETQSPSEIIPRPALPADPPEVEENPDSDKS